MRWSGWFLCALCAVFISCSSDNSSKPESIEAPESSSGTEDLFPLSSAESTASSAWESSSSSSLFVHRPGFDPCRFNFGAGWQSAHEDSAFYAGLDYISVWLGDNDFFNSFEARMFDVTRQVHATPMVYAYVIAEFGKDHGLVDCDIRENGVYVTPNHCTDGAQLIRDHFQDSILYRYRQYAAGFREHIEFFANQDPDTVQFIWLIEPDFYQYSESGSAQASKVEGKNFVQNGGGIPDSLMGVYFAQIVDTIRAYLPASKIAIDISPWILDQAAWYSNFDLSRVDFASTSGGRTAAGNSRIRASDVATWKGISELLHLPILADAGYDAGGYGTGYNKAWGNVDNLNARIADGVIGVTQMDPDSLYHVRVAIARSELSPTAFCNEN